MINETRVFNRNVFAGLVGGLFVYWASLATEEMIRILKLPPYYPLQMFMGLAFALLIFVVFALTNLAISPKRR